MAPRMKGGRSKGWGKCASIPGQTIRITETVIEIERLTPTPTLNPSWTYEDGTLTGLPDTIEISETIGSIKPFVEPGQAMDPSRVQALALLYELPLRLARRIISMIY